MSSSFVFTSDSNMHVVNARVGSQSDALSITCRLRLRLKKATDSQPSKIPWMDHGLLTVQTRGSRRMYFQHYLMKKGPPSRTPKESPEVYQIVRYVSLHPLDLRIRSLLQLYFSRVSDEKPSRLGISPQRRTSHNPNLRRNNRQLEHI